MIKDNIMFIGLDFETSTGDHRNLSPIQLGISLPSGEEFESLIALPEKHVWSMNSQEVHGIEMESLDDAPDIFEVDIRASVFMLDVLNRWHVPRMNRVIVGWNVGSFDRRIVYDYMPNLDKILSYRTLDINSVCYFVADMLDESYANLKRQAKEYAVEQTKAEEAWHDALYDARAGLYSYQYLTEIADKNMLEYAKQTVPK